MLIVGGGGELGGLIFPGAYSPGPRHYFCLRPGQPGIFTVRAQDFYGSVFGGLFKSRFGFGDY